MSRLLLANLKLGGKCFSEKNVRAYFAGSLIKSFIALVPDVVASAAPENELPAEDHCVEVVVDAVDVAAVVEAVSVVVAAVDADVGAVSVVAAAAVDVDVAAVSDVVVAAEVVSAAADEVVSAVVVGVVVSGRLWAILRRRLSSQSPLLRPRRPRRNRRRLPDWTTPGIKKKDSLKNMARIKRRGAANFG
jgi:hypothetical protein